MAPIMALVSWVYEIDTQKNGNFTQTNVHIFEAVNYHTKKKRKKKQSAHRFIKQAHNFFYFSKCFNPHTKFIDLKLKKNLHTELNLKIEMICNIYAFITSN